MGVPDRGNTKERKHGNGAQFPTNTVDTSKPGKETGKVTNWNNVKQFGFIKPDADGEDLFCHVSALVDGEGSVAIGDHVTYTKEFNTVKNKSLAVNVRKDHNAKPKAKDDAKDAARGKEGARDKDAPRDKDKRGGGDRDRGRDAGRDKERSRRDDEKRRGKSRDRSRSGRSKSKSKSRSRSRRRR